MTYKNAVVKKSWKAFIITLVILSFTLGASSSGAADSLNMQVFVKEPTFNLPTPQNLGPYEPAYGAILGATIDSDKRLNGNYDSINTVYGRPYSAVLVFVQWGDPLPADTVSYGKINNLALQVAWQPTAGLDAVQDDEYTQSMAHALSNYGGPIFLRFGGEMNGGWVAWGQQPRLYVEKFQLISTLMKQLAPNVAMVWAPNFQPDSVPGDATTFQYNVDQYYPGDNYVDWVGINGYADYYQQGEQSNDSTLPGNSWVMTNYHQGHHANPLLKYQKLYDEYASRKPIMLSEIGVAWYNNRDPQMDVTPWGVNTLERLYGYLPLMYPRIKAIFYFNQAVPGDCSRYSLYDNDAMYQAYKQEIASSYYLNKWDGTSSFSYQPLISPPSEICDLSTDINDEEGQVAEVDYYLDGNFVGKSTGIPWTVTCRFPSLGGQELLEVRALDDQGNVLAHTYQNVYVPVWHSVEVYLNGQQLSFNTKPADFYGTILVPLPEIANALEGQVSWDSGSQTATLNVGGSLMSIQVTPGSSAKLIGGTLMVPLKDIASNFGFTLTWAENGTAQLNQYNFLERSCLLLLRQIAHFFYLLKVDVLQLTTMRLR